MNLLLVEDSPPDARLIREMLRGTPPGMFDLALAASLGDALAQVRGARPDLILMDLGLPDSQGLDTLRATLAADPELPVVVLTGLSDHEFSVEAVRAGAQDYLVKGRITEEILTRTLLYAVERQRARLELARSEAAQRRLAETQMAILDALPAHIALIDAAGVIVSVNEAWRGFASANHLRSPEFGVGANYLEVCEAAGGEAAKEGRRAAAGIRAVARGESKEFSMEYRCDSASECRWFMLAASPLRAGQPGGAVLKHSDITERKLVEDRLSDQAALLDKASDAIVVSDLGRHILFWSQGAERMYGWRAGDVLGRPLAEVLHGDQARFAEAAEEVVGAGEWAGELKQATREGKRILVQSRWTLVKDGEGRPRSILALNSDITERKNLESQLLRAQRIESIGTLASGIAHDLNNVLAPIMMSCELLKASVSADDAELLETIASSARRGSELIKQVLSFSRGGERQHLEVEIPRLLQEIKGIASKTFPMTVRFAISSAGDLWRVRGDAGQLHQVFLNLCVNAKDAMPNGGVLTVLAENVVLDEDCATMSALAHKGAYVVVRVMDTGSGIPPEIIDKIFDPFFTTKEVGKGTGLGLSTSIGIVKSHLGFINVYSEMGKGTHFNVYLPATVNAAVAAAEIDQTKLPRGNGELILLVDDEEPIRKAVQSTLERFGYQVVTAANGAEAVSAYVRRAGAVALVVTDMTMPVMDGPALIVALKSLNPQIRVVGSSGLTSNGRMAAAMGAGVIHFIPKPYTAETLLRTVRMVLDEVG